MSELKRPALFLDRDGVINHDLGYTSRIEDFNFIPGIFDLCRAAHHAGYLLIVVTNQSGIGRGLYSESDFLLLTSWMCDRFEAEGAPIRQVFYCPFHPEHALGDYKRESFDRKPNPGMILRAGDMFDLDLPGSILIGDKESDMQAALDAGVWTRCHHRPNHRESPESRAATHEIRELPQAIPLLTSISCETIPLHASRKMMPSS